MTSYDPEMVMARDDYMRVIERPAEDTVTDDGRRQRVRALLCAAAIAGMERRWPARRRNVRAAMEELDRIGDSVQRYAAEGEVIKHVVFLSPGRPRSREMGQLWEAGIADHVRDRTLAA